MPRNFLDNITLMVRDVVSIEKVSHPIAIVSQLSPRSKSRNIVGVTKYNIECSSAETGLKSSNVVFLFP